MADNMPILVTGAGGGVGGVGGMIVRFLREQGWAVRAMVHHDDERAAPLRELGAETMARLHRQNRYDRTTDTVEAVTGKPAQTISEFVTQHADLFT